MISLNEYIDIDEQSETTEVVERKVCLVPDQAEFLTKAVEELSITLIDQSLYSMPREENERTAVVRCTTGTNDGKRFSVLGCTSPKTEGTTDPALLINAASYKGLLASLSCTRASVATQSRPIHDITPSNPTGNGGTNSQVKKYRHKTNEPLSPGQERFIQGLAQQKKLNPNEVSQKLLGKPLKDCSSADANEIIQQMKRVY